MFILLVWLSHVLGYPVYVFIEHVSRHAHF